MVPSDGDEFDIQIGGGAIGLVLLGLEPAGDRFANVS